MPVYSNIKPQDPSLEYVLPADAAASDPSTSTEEYDFDASLVVFTETKALDLTNKFRKEADAYYVEAKRSTVSSIAQVPYWMYGMLVVLGWNEAMAVLFNPMYFTIMLFLLAASYVFLIPLVRDMRLIHHARYLIFQLGLGGPLLQVTKTVAGEVRLCVPRARNEHVLIFCAFRSNAKGLHACANTSRSPYSPSLSVHCHLTMKSATVSGRKDNDRHRNSETAYFYL